jgi:hypothetical protein
VVNKKYIQRDDVMFFCMESSAIDQVGEGDAEAFVEAMDIEGKGHIDIHK